MSGSKKWWELWDHDVAFQVCGTKKEKMAEDGAGNAIYNTVPNIDGAGLSFDETTTVSCADCGWSKSSEHRGADLLREAVMHERKCPVARERRFSESIERLTAAITKEKAP